MTTRNCSLCGTVTNEKVVCTDCFGKGLTVEMVKNLSIEDLKLLNEKITKLPADKITRDLEFILEMIDARLYPTSYRAGC